MRYEADAEARAAIGRKRAYALAGETDIPAMEIGVPHDRREQRRFADPVSAQHRQGAARRELGGDALEHHGVAVARPEILDIEPGVVAHECSCSPR